MEVAREVFSRHGYDGTTFQEVATRAGMTRPALRYYYEDKLAMYHDVIKSTYTRVVMPAVGHAERETTLPRQLSVFVEMAGAAIAEDRAMAAFLCISVAECQIRPELRDPNYCPITVIRKLLTWAVNGALDRGEFSSSTEAAILVDALAAILSGIGFYAAFVGEPQRSDRVAAQIQQLLASAFRTDSYPPPACHVTVSAASLEKAKPLQRARFSTPGHGGFNGRWLLG